MAAACEQQREGLETLPTVMPLSDSAQEQLNPLHMLRFGPASVEADGRIRLPVDGASWQRVRLQRSANLVDWEDWQTMTLGGNATGCGLIDNTPAARQRFYRVVEDTPRPTDEP